MKGFTMKKRFGFTLAEVLITLAIIGVVAAMTIPSVIVNTNQQEFKTGLRKAVSVLNSSIGMNLALEGETPYDNADLFGFLQQHMAVMKSTVEEGGVSGMPFNNDSNNAFYTTDGFRFEFPTKEDVIKAKGDSLHEASKVNLAEDRELTGNGDFASHTGSNGVTYKSMGKCGSLGLANANSTTNPPCIIMVDVNGDRKPNPQKATERAAYNTAQPEDRLLKDVFTIMITDEKAVPFGIQAQKAMYQAQK